MAMNTPEIISPVNNIEEINLVKKTNCKGVYLKYPYNSKKHLSDSLKDLVIFAKSSGFKVFIKFKSNIKENEINKIREFVDNIEDIGLDGVLINDFGILKALADKKSDIPVFIDSSLNIHNISSIDFLKKQISPEVVNLNEEIYINNLSKIRNYCDCKIAIDCNNLPWIAEDILNDESVDLIVLNGKFNNSEELYSGISTIEQILENPAENKNQKLPFKNFENSAYRSDHFTEEFQSARGRSFKFSGNIYKYKWKYKRFRPFSKNIKSLRKLPALNLRLTSVEQLKELKKFVKRYRIKAVKAVEFGEILSTANLSKNSFNKIIEKVKQDCFECGIKLKIGTPRILLERDYDRVYEYTKTCFQSAPRPYSLVVNNIGYWWSVVNDRSFNVKIETGYGLNLKNSESINFLNEIHAIECVDFSEFTNIENLKQTIDRIKNNIPFRQITIAGNKRILSSGMCPLNRDSAVLSRLSCPAPCHSGAFSIQDRAVKKVFPFAVDGFCRMHLFKDQILDMYKFIPIFKGIGINEFILDFSCLPAKMVPLLLKRFINSVSNIDYSVDPNFYEIEYGIDRYLSKF